MQPNQSQIKNRKSKIPFSCLLLLLASSVGPYAADQPVPEVANLIENGNAEQVDAGGALVDWSVYVREGKATLQQTTADKVEGHAAARLELHREGANFDVKTGRAVLPPRSEDTTYLFTADVKSEADKGREPGAYFALGTESDLQLDHFRHNAGWQKVRAKITIPANEELRRLELSGGSAGPAVIFIDNVRLRKLDETVEKDEQLERDPLETAIKLEACMPIWVRKILPTDCRLVRGFTHAPVDGRVDTRYSTGAVSEWKGIYGEPTLNYRAFNGNNGLHIKLAEDSFDALQIRGGWRGRLYADVDGLIQPGPETQIVCEIRPLSDAFRRLFKEPVQARRLSFFYTDWEQANHGKPLADATFLQVKPGEEFPGSVNRVRFNLGRPAEPDEAIQQSLQARFNPADRAYRLGEETGEKVSLQKDEFLHLVTPPQDTSQGIGAVSLQLEISQIEPDSLLTVRVQDVLDPRRESMGVDFQVPGPGAYSIVMDMPDQVFLPPEESQRDAPRLESPIAPPPVLWMSIAAETPMTLGSAVVTLHQIPRAQALAEAGAWRTFLLKGLFSTMSEPRPWMHLDNQSPVREQIDTKKSIERYRVSLLELLENAEAARLLLPNADIVRQYYEWLYQAVDRDKPHPPPTLDPVPGAPRWAVLVRQGWRELNHIAQWWIENRLVPDGELGGHPGDDTDMFQTWQCLPMIESEPLGVALKEAAACLAELTWNGHLEEGINIRTTDALHAYEEGVNQLALCAWWFYGDPIHYERVMISARSVMKLMVETDDGRLHFGSKHVGIDQMRNGYETIGVTPGDASWCPIRLLLHPVYVAALYNRNPALVEKFERWGRTWSDYQRRGAYVGQVEILTGKPTKVSKLPSAAAVGPVNEWLALYQVTGDPKWQEPFKFLMDSGGYWGTTVQYGRMPHTLVRWEEPYQQRMRERFAGSERGYAGFFLNKDRSQLDQWLADSAFWYGRFRHIHTAAEQKTDRVLTYKATTPIACYLGDAPNRNRWLNFNAVSYEDLRGEDFAALVWDAGPATLKVAIYNFNDEPLTGLMRVWRLDHGRYQVQAGPDEDDDGAMDKAAWEQEIELQRYAPIPLQLPAKQTTILEVEQLERLDDILERADLALSPIDTRLRANGELEVKVHNIGARPAKDLVVHLIRGNRVVESQTIEEIEDPGDLEPKVVSLRFKGSQPGDELVVDPDDAIPEIAEHNNRLMVQATSP